MSGGVSSRRSWSGAPSVLQPEGWLAPKGYANGMMAEGRLVVTALIATGASTLTDYATKDAGMDANTRTLLIEVAYFGAFAVTFVGKFLVLDRYVFAGSPRRSRAQVDSTTPL